VPKELLRVHKSKVPTTPFAYAYMLENSAYLRKKFFSMNNEAFDKYIDLTKLQEHTGVETDRMMHKEYLKMIFFKKKINR
jgi:hypothetical protein